MRLALILALILAAPASADVADAVDRHILPGTAAFAAAAADLDAAAEAKCDRQALGAPFDAAWDAWLAIAHLRLGPAEVDGRSLAIAYWPDPKGQGLRAQIDLLRGDPARLEPAAFVQQSVASRGLTGLERLIFQPDAFSADDTCPLIRATARDLAAMAAAIDDGWRAGYADLLLSAGSTGNTVFLTPAEARASARSARNLGVSIAALRDLAAALVPEAAATLAALDRAAASAARLPDPIFADAATPAGRFRLEVVQGELVAARALAATEIAGQLGVGVGFNSADGD